MVIVRWDCCHMQASAFHMPFRCQPASLLPLGGLRLDCSHFFFSAECVAEASSHPELFR